MVCSRSNGSSISWGRAVGVIDRPLGEVLPVVVDYENYVQFMPNFTKSQVLAQRGNRAMVYMEVSVASGTFTLPSSCWHCSRIATSVRPIARPDPLMVCTGCGLVLGAGR